MAIFKAIVKSVAKGYMALADRTRGWTTAVREDVHDAIESARHEREREASDLEVEPTRPRRRATAASTAPTGSKAPAKPAGRKRNTAKSAAKETGGADSAPPAKAGRTPRRAATTHKASDAVMKHDRHKTSAETPETTADTSGSEASS